ncbi:Testis-expressed protein 101 [Myotis brandtii]|uniref:Testis-expressed protein 101 n=1 Tax=Myotis brandtii TaxID=109478 RepID=S7PDM1_MYOBR|nr:Testis-expressed protein 101 [Myotis brandtii]
MAHGQGPRNLMFEPSGDRAKRALLATKGGSTEEIPAIMFVQHFPTPGIMVVSYSSFCEHSFCNNRKNIPEIWNPEVIPDRARCSFPFTFKNKLYHTCTTDGSFIKKAWCSVTANYDKDGAWKGCF